jgi:hypothetical protein
MNASGERLLERDFVNVVLALVVATCVAGPILVQRTGRRALAAAHRAPRIHVASAIGHFLRRLAR